VEMEAKRLQEEGGGGWLFPIRSATYRICDYSTEKYVPSSLPHFITQESFIIPPPLHTPPVVTVVLFLSSITSYKLDRP
jgi:hypothetical protein